VVNDAIVGAGGVRGAASAAQDTEFARAAALALAGGSTASAGPGGAVIYLESARVREGFRKGDVLVNEGAYMVHASHRDQAGLAEVHTEETDIIYVLAGEATFVTGGRMENAREIGPGELRGAAIVGGEERRLRPGDVMVVPGGTPHWFREVPGSFDYYVVKVRRSGGLS
jgi:mannose-6-phosphate isomerase-like protein (cupin superfamily)